MTMMIMTIVYKAILSIQEGMRHHSTPRHNCNSQQHSKANVDNCTYWGTALFPTTPISLHIPCHIIPQDQLLQHIQRIRIPKITLNIFAPAARLSWPTRIPGGIDQIAHTCEDILAT